MAFNYLKTVFIPVIKDVGSVLTELEKTAATKEEDGLFAEEGTQKDEVVDAQMAKTIINDFFEDESAQMGTDEIVGTNVQDAIATVSESSKAQTYSENVYTSKISSKTDSATIDENREAIGKFMDAYYDASDIVHTQGDNLSDTDKSKFDTVSKVQERLNEGEYILTKEIDKATAAAKTIHAKSSEIVDSDSKLDRAKGSDILTRLEAAVTNDETIQDEADNKLTQNEYEKLKFMFENAKDPAVAYRNLAEEAKKYGIAGEQ